MARIEAVNEQTLIVYLGDKIDEAVAAEVNHAIFQIQHALGNLITDIIPSYNSILVNFDQPNGQIRHHQTHQTGLSHPYGGRE